MLPIGDDNDTMGFPVVNTLLICATVGVFAWQICSSSFLPLEHAMVPARFLDHFEWSQVGTILSSVFLHADFFHILGNMWFLFIFGDNIEDQFGHWNYLFFYLACGMLGGLVYVAGNPDSMIPAIGASGAISGVLGAYLVLHPNAKIKTWWGDDSLLFAFRTFMIPAWIVIGAWFLLQYAGLLLEVPGVGWLDHIGGFTAGMLIVLLFKTCGETSTWRGDVRIQEELSTHHLVSRATLSVVLVGALIAASIMYFAGDILAKVGSSKQPQQITSAAKQQPDEKTDVIVEKKPKSKTTTNTRHHKRHHSKQRKHSRKTAKSAH